MSAASKWLQKLVNQLPERLRRPRPTARRRRRRQYTEDLESRQLLTVHAVPSATFLTIEAALSSPAVVDGDVVELAEGEYIVNLTVTRNISIRGAGMGATILKGDPAAMLPVLRVNGVTTAAFEDMTLTDGKQGGIEVINSAATFRNLDVVNNIRQTAGSGIRVTGNSSPLFLENKIRGNVHYTGQGFSGGFGAIHDESTGSSIYIGNEVAFNDSWNTGSIVITAGSPLIHDNYIHDNFGDFSGGIIVFGGTSRIEHNTIVNNRVDFRPDHAGGIDVINGSATIRFNTIDGNDGAGIAIRTGTAAVVEGNIVTSNKGTGIISSGNSTFYFNNVFGHQPNYAGSTATPDPGSLEENPRLQSDYRLSADSPLIDRGPPAARDIDGGPADIGASGGRGLSNSETYSVTTVIAERNVEHRLYRNGSHFASLIATDAVLDYHQTFIDSDGKTKYAKHGLIFRPRPDVNLPDTWGLSEYLNSFLAGGDAEAGRFQNIVATKAGIFFRAAGEVIRDAVRTSAGVWSAFRNVTFDPDQYVVKSSGTHEVRLNNWAGTQSGDLNINRIASNKLVNVPLTNGGSGNTGDTHSVKIARAPADGLPEETWYPENGNKYFPEKTTAVSVDMIGMTNSVDTRRMGQQPINVVRKPGYQLLVENRDASSILTLYTGYNESDARDPYADNIGVSALVTSANAGQQNTFRFNVASNAIIPLTPLVDNGIETAEDTSSAPIRIQLAGDDGSLAPWFRIDNVTGGLLLKPNGVPIADGFFITYAEGLQGLLFHPHPNSNQQGSFTVESSRDGRTAAPRSGRADTTIRVRAVADMPEVADRLAVPELLSAPITIRRNSVDGDEVTHMRIDDIAGGSLFHPDGVTPIRNGTWLTVSDAAAGVRFLLTQGTAVGRFNVTPSIDGTTVDALSSKATCQIFADVAPTITSPASVTPSLNPTFSWTSNVNAFAYEIWIDKAGTKSPLLRTIVWGTNTWTPDAQTTGIGRFSFWVRYRRGNLASRWSPRYSVQINTPVTPAAMSAVQTTSTPTISWPSLPGAVRYEVWVDSGTTSKVYSNQNITSNSITLPPLSMAAFKLWIRAFDSTGTAARWSAMTSFQILLPVSVPPAPTATFDRTPEFRWTAVSGAVSYNLQIRDANSGAVILNSNVNGLSFSPSQDLSKGLYRWQVLAVSSTGARSQSATTQELFVGGRSSILAPVAASAENPPNIVWAAVEQAVRYQVFVSRLDVVIPGLINVSLLSPLTSFKPVAALPKGTYRVWVQAFSAVDAGPWSLPQTFVV